MLTALAAALADPWFDAIAVIFAGYFILCGVVGARVWHGRSRHIDAVINALLPEADTRLIEHERQRMRAEHAVRRRDAAERRMRGAS